MFYCDKIDILSKYLDLKNLFHLKFVYFQMKVYMLYDSVFKIFILNK